MLFDNSLRYTGYTSPINKAKVAYFYETIKLSEHKVINFTTIFFKSRSYRRLLPMRCLPQATILPHGYTNKSLELSHLRHKFIALAT